MIYLLTERVMKGTVTLDIRNTGVEAKSFGIACEKATHFENWKLAENIVSDGESFSYTMPLYQGLQVWGMMKNKPLEIV